MYPIRPLVQPCMIDSFLGSSFQKEDLLSVLPTSLPGQSQNSGQYVGGDVGDTLALDSRLSKHTKCTNGSQSSIVEDYESPNFPISPSKKSQEKQLKKQMKKQKIKRKQQEQINLNHKNFQKVNIETQILTPQGSSIIQSSPGDKNIENSFDRQSLSLKREKLTPTTFANPNPLKRIHTQNGSAPSKSHLSYLSLLQLDDVKTFLDKTKDTKTKQNLFLEQTRIIQQDALQYSGIQDPFLGNYFVDDLKLQLVSNPSRKSNKKDFQSKLSFLQNVINHSQNYQIPIEVAKPHDSQIKKINLERKSSDKGKMTLLIDLDDTLIFTSKPVQSWELKDDDLKITQNDGKFRKLNLRPYAREFLQRMSRHYEIIIFTAATKCYAQQIRKILDPTGTLISHLLDRQYCFNPNKQSGKSKLPFIKDLRKLNRDLSQTVLLDNSIYCFWYQINNGIPIISYNKQNKSDNQLLKVESYLLKLIKQSDVRDKNREYFKLQEYEQHVDAHILVKELYMKKQTSN